MKRETGSREPRIGTEPRAGTPFGPGIRREKDMTENDDKSESVFQKMKDKAKGVQTGIAGKISKASEAGWTKLKETTQTASGLHDKIHIAGMKSDTAAITLDLPPKINLKFKK
jgi:hypothetical protein